MPFFIHLLIILLPLVQDMSPYCQKGVTSYLGFGQVIELPLERYTTQEN